MMCTQRGEMQPGCFSSLKPPKNVESRKVWPRCSLVHADSLSTLYRGRLPGLPGVRYLA